MATDGEPGIESGDDYESMSIPELRALVMQKGFSMPGAGSEKSDLIALLRSSEVDFDEEARVIFATANLHPSARSRYTELDAIWQHPVTGARLFVGNQTAAHSRRTLGGYGISAIVNCLPESSPNAFEDDEGMDYMRFPIANWAREGIETPEDVMGYFGPYFSFVDEHLAEGRSVLVHCLAGAHRAGTAGCGYLMFKTGLDPKGAISMARRFRHIINPIHHLLGLLDRLGAALRADLAGAGAAGSGDQDAGGAMAHADAPDAEGG